jgi:hypothetical protein
MKIAGVILGAFALFVAGGAVADPNGDALTKFGLPGHWALRCQEPPGPRNPHQFFVVSPIGDSIEQTAGDPNGGNAVLLLSNVHILGSDQIAYTTTINGTLYNLVVTKNGNKRKTMEVVSAAGQAAISHGIVLATGAETPWLERCPD